MAPLLAAERAKPNWEWDEKCTDVRKGRDQRYCAQITGLESELATAKRAEGLAQQLAALDQRLASATPAAQKVDPQARIIASFTGWDKDSISDRLPVATPIILELGSMTLLYFSFVLLGLSHTHAMEARVLGRAASTHAPTKADVALLPAALLPVKRTATLTRQRELADWFFRNCSRPAEDGALTEASWYQHYQDVCKESSDVPLPLPSFRRFAERYIPEIREVDGTIYYKRVLPYIPKRAA